MAYSENPESFVARILAEVFDQAHGGEYDLVPYVFREDAPTPNSDDSTAPANPSNAKDKDYIKSDGIYWQYDEDTRLWEQIDPSVGEDAPTPANPSDAKDKDLYIQNGGIYWQYDAMDTGVWERTDPFFLFDKLGDDEVLPEDRVYPNFQPEDAKGIEVENNIRLLLPAVVYQPLTGVWSGGIDPVRFASGYVRLGKPQLKVQTVQIDVRDLVYPVTIKLANAIINALVAGQRVAGITGPTFTYSQVPGETELHRRIYTFEIVA